MVELIVWHEPTWISHGDAVARSQEVKGLARHQAVVDFHQELAAQTPDVGQRGDRKSHVRLAIDDASARKVVPRVRYLAAKHRLVCFDVRAQAVLNPPLLRRTNTLELSSDAGFPIDDPTPEHIARTAYELGDDNWFMALEGDDDTFLQCGVGARAGVADGYMIELREDKLLQAPAPDLATVIAVFQSHLAGDDSWRQRFEWRVVDLS